MSKIVIADDDVDFCAVLRESLELMGHEVHVAHHGAEALGLLENAEAELVMLDVLMPRGGAISLVHAIRSSWPKIAIIVMTGNPAIYDSPIVSDGMRFADRTLAKPIAFEQLSDAVSALTGGR